MTHLTPNNRVNISEHKYFGFVLNASKWIQPWQLCRKVSVAHVSFAFCVCMFWMALFQPSNKTRWWWRCLQKIIFHVIDSYYKTFTRCPTCFVFNISLFIYPRTSFDGLSYEKLFCVCIKPTIMYTQRTSLKWSKNITHSNKRRPHAYTQPWPGTLTDGNRIVNDKNILKMTMYWIIWGPIFAHRTHTMFAHSLLPHSQKTGNNKIKKKNNNNNLLHWIENMEWKSAHK